MRLSFAARNLLALTSSLPVFAEASAPSGTLLALPMVLLPPMLTPTGTTMHTLFVGQRAARAHGPGRAAGRAMAHWPCGSSAETKNGHCQHVIARHVHVHMRADLEICSLKSASETARLPP